MKAHTQYNTPLFARTHLQPFSFFSLPVHLNTLTSIPLQIYSPRAHPTLFTNHHFSPPSLSHPSPKSFTMRFSLALSLTPALLLLSLATTALSAPNKQATRAEIVARASRPRGVRPTTPSPLPPTPIVCGDGQPFYLQYKAPFSPQHEQYAIIRNQPTGGSSQELYGGASVLDLGTRFFLDEQCRLAAADGRYRECSGSNALRYSYSSPPPVNSYYTNRSNKLYFDSASYSSSSWPAAYCTIGTYDRKLTCEVGGRSVFHLCPTIRDDAAYSGQPGNLPNKCYEITLKAVLPPAAPAPPPPAVTTV